MNSSDSDLFCWNCLLNSSNFTELMSTAKENYTNGSEIFTRRGIRICLIVAYTFVFACCFFGNLTVIIVVMKNRRMKTVTNFFLTNLAFADMCVGLFCVYQNLSLYLTSSWAFGDFLCKIYHFVHALSYTASIFILTIICVERYLAIIHPIWSKQVLTLRKLRIVIVIAWIVSGAYCSPRLFIFGVGEIPSQTGRIETICFLKRYLYDSKIYDLVNFVICFLLPLTIITILYSVICVRLWTRKVAVATNESISKRCSSNAEDTEVEEIELASLSDSSSIKCISRNPSLRSKKSSRNKVHNSSGNSVLRVRRKVIKLLVVVVLAFALCHLPFHVRKLWQVWSRGYRGSSYNAVALTIITTLILYMNSGINPFLYAFLSENFRRSMADVLFCRLRRGYPVGKFKKAARSLNTHTG